MLDNYIYNLGRMFEGVAAQYSSKVAISFPGGDEITFAQLNHDANAIATLLKAKGIKKYDVCAIAGVKKRNTYSAFIACVKLGITYTFFDPESPEDRLSKILIQCTPKIVLGYMKEIEAFDSLNYFPTIDLGESEITVKIAEDVSLNQSEEEVEGSCPAYIMFTSGSTGFPKGAVMTHANLINFIHWGKQTFSITTKDIHTNVNPLYFDNSVFDLYCSLFNGAALVPVSKKESINPRNLLQILKNNKCTTWFSVPSLLIYLQTTKAIIPEQWSTVKKIIFGGEGYPKAKLINLYNSLKHNTTLYNVYGPTECTCICSSYEVSENDFIDLNGFLPLGKMAKNFTYYIVDERMKQSDEKGDLILGGPNVGLGYFNDPIRTSERFIQNPFHQNYKDICYITGDLVSFNKADNKIYIHGRTDNQIKHMGYRIELEEIENAICQLHYINEAAAFVIGDSNNNKIFAVYESSTEIDFKTMKEDLKKYLPGYMIPSEIYKIERIPKNANGKTDRLSLQKTYQN